MDSVALVDRCSHLSLSPFLSLSLRTKELKNEQESDRVLKCGYSVIIVKNRYLCKYQLQFTYRFSNYVSINE